MIAFLERLHVGADVDYHARAFVAKDGREQPFRVRTRQCEFVGMANAGGLDFHQHFAGPWPVKIDVFDGERCACFVRDGGFDFHASS